VSERMMDKHGVNLKVCPYLLASTVERFGCTSQSETANSIRKETNAQG
jgi:hypothetical protein